MAAKQNVHARQQQKSCWLACLVDGIVRHWVAGEHLGLLHGEASLGHGRGALGDNLLALSLTRDFGSVVHLDALEELITAAGLDDMLHTNMNTFVDDAATEVLVHNDTHSVGGDIPHAASSAVVVLVGHALLDGGVGLDIDVVTKLVVDEVGRQIRHATLTKRAREHVAGGAAVTL